jgi:methionyl-tRNA formyltransferase
MTIRILFFGNSQSTFSNRLFETLVGTPGELAGVVDAPAEKRRSTNPEDEERPSFVHLARSSGIPDFEPHSPNHPDFVSRAGELSPDLLLCIGYPRILKKDILEVPRLLAVNFHASLLPAYRGKHPVFWALRNGERWAGLTVHQIDPGIDTGDMLYQVRLRTRKDDRVETLYDRIIERSRELVGKLVADLARGGIVGVPQEPGAGSYYSSVKEADFRLDLNRPAETLRRWIHTTPGECYLELTSQRAYIPAARVIPAQTSRPTPGLISHLGKRSGTLEAGRDGLRLSRIRTADGKTISFARFCANLGLGEGDFLSPGPG